jgi:hypothetical protein
VESVFTIGKVGWVVKRLAPHETRCRAVDSFWHLHEFLRTNGLLVRPLATTRDEVDNDEFAIRSNDVTAEGMAVIREGYDRWCKALDRGTPPSKVTILEKALAKVRAARTA